MSAGTFEASQSEGVPKDVDSIEGIESKVLVVILVGSLIVGIEGVEVDEPRRQFGDQRLTLTSVLEVRLSDCEAQQKKADYDALLV